jgi:MFS transporter, YNFM family, putative membrane transport protein
MMAPAGLPRAVVWGIGFLAFLNLYPMQAVLHLLMAEYNADAVQVGATVGATVLAISLLSPFVGFLSDASGRRGLIVGALFSLALLTAAIPLSQHLDTIVAMRFLQGMAIPGVTVVLTAYLAEEFEGNELSRLMAAYISGGVFGGFSGRFMVGYAIRTTARACCLR